MDDMDCLCLQNQYYCSYNSWKGSCRIRVKSGKFRWDWCKKHKAHGKEFHSKRKTK